GMGFRIDVGVYPEGHRGAPAQLSCDVRYASELRLGFEVQTEDAVAQRELDFPGAFADTGEDRLAGISARSENARELAPRDDIETGAEAREERKDREVGICLHGIADQCVAAAQRFGVFAVSRLDRGARVDIAGRAEAA